MQVSLTFDYLCPFARIGNLTMLSALEAGLATPVSFRAFSLAQVHRDPAEPPVWKDEEQASGVLALEWGLVVRDHAPRSFPAVHRALFAVRHEHGEHLREDNILKAVAAGGADVDALSSLVEDGAGRRALEADHTWCTEVHQVFGVPTFIADDRAAFVRLTALADDDLAARRSVERILELLSDWPQLNEFKHPTLPA